MRAKARQAASENNTISIHKKLSPVLEIFSKAIFSVDVLLVASLPSVLSIISIEKHKHLFQQQIVVFLTYLLGTIDIIYLIIFLKIASVMNYDESLWLNNNFYFLKTFNSYFIIYFYKRTLSE